MKKSLIAAGAASVALAAMPVLGVFATDVQQVQDTIQITVDASCTFTDEGSASPTGATYSGNGSNGESVTLSNSGLHTFNVFCNNNKGYTVSATANDLAATGDNNPVITDKFYYKQTLSSTAGAQGEWHAQIASNVAALTVNQLSDSTSGSATGTIITRPSSAGATTTAGDEWTATYTALIGTDTTAATYSGTISYTLAPTN